MKLQKFFLVFAVLFSFQICFGQEKSKAELYLDMGYNSCDTTKGFINDLYVELGNNPNLKALIVIYGEQNNPLKSYKYESLMKDIIANFLKYDPDLVSFAHAKSEKNLRVEFWLIPSEAEKPTFSEENWDYILPVTTKPFTFYQDNWRAEWCETTFDAELYSKLLLNNQNLHGNIIIREKSVTEFRKIQKKLSDELNKNYQVPLNRLKFSYAKSNKTKLVEYWLVPQKK